MLTLEERDVVVAAMRKYPAGVSRKNWGKSPEFFNKFACDAESLPDAVLLEGG